MSDPIRIVPADDETRIRNQQILADACPEFLRGVESVLTIRCMEHRAVPAYNTKESGGGECAACVVIPLLAALNEVWKLLTPGQRGCAVAANGHIVTNVAITYGALAKIRAAITQAEGRTNDRSRRRKNWNIRSPAEMFTSKNKTERRNHFGKSKRGNPARYPARGYSGV